MFDWKADALVKLEEAWVSGEDTGLAAQRIVKDFESTILLDAEFKLIKSMTSKQTKRWAEPPVDMPQLRFELEGVEFAVPDTPVRWIDEEGDERFKPARQSTGDEREASLEARIDHHQNWVRRTEAEHRREVEQNSNAAQLGVDLATVPWDMVRHMSTTCWRCGGGYRAGDPFEYGHVDKPASQGGRQVAWEHRSCNRSAGDSPVTEPYVDDDPDF